MSKITGSTIYTNERIKKGYDLQKYLENHSPLIVYPFGFYENDDDKYDSDRCTRVPLAEGFIYPDGVLFLTAGWNYNDGSGYSSGPGPAHWLPGKVEEPISIFQTRAFTCYGGIGWKVGKALIIVPSLPLDEKLLPELEDYLSRIKGKEKETRAEARKVADRVMEDMNYK